MAPHNDLSTTRTSQAAIHSRHEHEGHVWQDGGAHMTSGRTSQHFASGSHQIQYETHHQPRHDPRNDPQYGLRKGQQQADHNAAAQAAFASSQATTEKAKQEVQEFTDQTLRVTNEPPRLSRDKSVTRKRGPFRFSRFTARHPTTIFDSQEWKDGQFFGFYVLFWVVVAAMALREFLLAYAETGLVLPTVRIIHLLRKDLFKVALTDLAMYLGMYVTYGMVVLSQRGYVDWWSRGWIYHHTWQTIYTLSFIWLARKMEFPWIAQIFLALHVLVQTMKQHSYQVYNGYMQHLRKELEHTDVGPARDKLKGELSNIGHGVSYPHNVTLGDFFMFTMYPVIVYETDYPRTTKIRWGYVVHKLSATFGVFGLLIMIAERFLYPVAMEAVNLRNEPYGVRLRTYPIVLLRLFPAFISAYMLVFYLIWDAILNSLAELTRFDDRQFYRTWWNSTTWDMFARDWNVPVHNFLRRHVYQSSIITLNFTKAQAVILTFVLSACVHELAMYVIFGRLRGYLLLMQLTQLPLEYMSTLPFLKKRRVLGITLFWMGIAVGPSILCSLYLTF